MTDDHAAPPPAGDRTGATIIRTDHPPGTAGSPPGPISVSMRPTPSLPPFADPSFAARDATPLPSFVEAPPNAAWVSVAATIPPDPHGVRRLGGFELRGLLGEGGMGKVYLAHDPTLHRLVALKTLRPELAAISTLRDRFIEEARSVARLNHLNIIQIYAAGIDGSTPFFAMELIEGKSLREHLAEEGPMALNRVLDYTIQTVRGLAAAYDRRLVHRDIKPANLMLVRDGTVKIADFGLAKKLDGDLELTRTGTFVGSPYYMRPEQSDGRPLDFRTDVYSLGASMYHLLTGLPPFEGNTPTAVMLKHLNEPLPRPEPLATLRGGLVHELIARMMAKRPDDRFASYAELLAALEALQASPDGSEARRLIGAGVGAGVGAGGPGAGNDGGGGARSLGETVSVGRIASLPARTKGGAGATVRKKSAAKAAGGGSRSTIVAAIVGAALVLVGIAAGMMLLESRRNVGAGTGLVAAGAGFAGPTATDPTGAARTSLATDSSPAPAGMLTGPPPSAGVGSLPTVLTAKPTWTPLLDLLPAELRGDPTWTHRFLDPLMGFHYIALVSAVGEIPGIDGAVAARTTAFLHAIGRGTMELQQQLAVRVQAGEDVTVVVEGLPVRIVDMHGASYRVRCAGTPGGAIIEADLAIRDASPAFLLAAMMEAAEPRTPRTTAVLLGFNYLFDARRPTADLAPELAPEQREAIGDVIAYLAQEGGGPPTGSMSSPQAGAQHPAMGAGARRPPLRRPGEGAPRRQ